MNGEFKDNPKPEELKGGSQKAHNKRKRIAQFAKKKAQPKKENMYVNIKRTRKDAA